uniref:Uncharacterized protein n=1 Tax=Solanum lycopersicum TaxID=4081 RepID=A0A3Q7GLG8_SOLLC
MTVHPLTGTLAVFLRGGTDGKSVEKTPGTSTFLGLLNLVVKAVAVVVSLYAGNNGKMGLVVVQLEEQDDFLYSRMAVAVRAKFS